MHRFIRAFAVLVALSTSSRALSETADAPYVFGLEIDPIMSLLSVLPGMTSMGLGFEVALSPNLSFTTGYDQIAMKLTDKQIAENEKDFDEEDPRIRSVTGQTVSPGMRFHFSGTGHSFYAGAFASLASFDAGFLKDEESYELSGTSVSPGAELGYRWRWSAFVIRLGGRYAQSVASKNEIEDKSTGETLSDDEAKTLLGGEAGLEDATDDVAGSASVDFTLGVVF